MPLNTVAAIAALRDPASAGQAQDPSETGTAADRLAIRELVENWVVWRDSGDFARFRTLWADEGIMMATWTQGSADYFIQMTKEGLAKGVSILHFLGGNSAEIHGNRAISQTKMTISQRAKVDGQRVDVVCTGRFYDFLEKRNDKWLLVLRQPIYEKDRMDVIDPDPANPLTVDQAILSQFPEGYQHLAYLQTKIGYKVKTDMPGLWGPGVEALYARGKQWLAGGPAQ